MLSSPFLKRFFGDSPSWSGPLFNHLTPSPTSNLFLFIFWERGPLFYLFFFSNLKNCFPLFFFFFSFFFFFFFFKGTGKRSFGVLLLQRDRRRRIPSPAVFDFIWIFIIIFFFLSLSFTLSLFSFLFFFFLVAVIFGIHPPLLSPPPPPHRLLLLTIYNLTSFGCVVFKPMRFSHRADQRIHWVA